MPTKKQRIIPKKMEHKLNTVEENKKMKRNGLDFKDNVGSAHLSIEQVPGRNDKIIKDILKHGHLYSEQ